jgi:hypothetical protein
MSNKYQIELNEDQLREIIHALEVVARLNIGQLDMAIDCCLDKNGHSVGTFDLARQVESIVKPKMGLDLCASWGVGKFAKTDMIWDMYEVFRHHYSWQRAVDNGIVDSIMKSKRDWSCMMSVYYDEPMHHNTNVKLPKIETKTEKRK